MNTCECTVVTGKKGETVVVPVLDKNNKLMCRVLFWCDEPSTLTLEVRNDPRGYTLKADCEWSGGSKSRRTTISRKDFEVRLTLKTNTLKYGKKLKRQGEDFFDVCMTAHRLFRHLNSCEFIMEENAWLRHVGGDDHTQSRFPCFPNEVSENIAKFVLQSEWGIDATWNTNAKDLVCMDTCTPIEIKAVTTRPGLEHGPTSFATNTDCTNLYFMNFMLGGENNSLDMYKYTGGKERLDDMVMNIDKKEKFGDQCKKGKRPRIRFSTFLERMKDCMFPVCSYNLTELFKRFPHGPLTRNESIEAEKLLSVSKIKDRKLARLLASLSARNIVRCARVLSSGLS